MPRKNKDRPSRRERDDRIRRERADDPFGGDTEALRAELFRRLMRHREALGMEELRRRVRARGLDPDKVAEVIAQRTESAR
jgi:hypothetical protein